MNEFHALREAGLVDDPEPDMYERAQRVLLDYIGSNDQPLRRRRSRRPLAFVSGAAAVIVVVVVVVLTAGVNSPGSATLPTGLGHTGPVSGRLVRLISLDSATAMAHSGTAQVLDKETASENSVTQAPSKTATSVTFSGQNLDEVQTPVVASGTNNPTKAMATEFREVNGQNYIYSPKPPDMDQDQWYGPTPSLAGQLFPDPRTLMQAISPSAGLVAIGQESVDGVLLTHLRAMHPAELGDASLLGIGPGVTSFDVWVDAGDIVQRMAWTATWTMPRCAMPATLPTFPSVVVRSTESIQFADLGQPETVTAPAGAVPFATLPAPIATCTSH